MHSPSRRAVALLATTLTLGAGSLATVAQASAGDTGTADGSTTRADRGLVDAVVLLVLSLLGANPTVAQVQSAVGGLTGGQLGGLLAGATPGQLDALLGGGLSPAQLTSAVTSLLGSGELDGVLDTLTAGQTGDLLAPLSDTALSSTLALLNPSQILDALGTLNPTELASVVDGLSPAQTGTLLAGADPTALTALVGALTQGQLGGGLAVLDTGQLTSLLSVANAALAGALPGADTSALQNLVSTLTALLGAGPGPGPGPGPGTLPGTTLPGSTLSRSGANLPAQRAVAKPPAFTGYRATIRSVKVARNRRSAKVAVSCPAAAPAGCIVTLKGAVAGRKAFSAKPFVLMRTLKRTFTAKLSTAATRRLRKKGGSIKVTARTMFSSLPATTKTVRVARRR